MEARSERRSVVASGKTVEEAITNGLTMLGVHRNEVDIEVLSEGSRGVLGFGAENARVRLLVKLRAEPEVPEVIVPATEPALREGEEPRLSQAPEVEEDILTPEKVGRELLLNLLRLMGIKASVETALGYEIAEEGQPPPLVLNITGEDLGILIGRRGETLRALQYLVRLMASHRLRHWNDLVIDVENYRVRRRQTLESLAQRMAERVASSGHSQALEPMPAYDRRLVHIVLRNHPKVRTESVGEGERRRVTIVPRQR